MGLQNTVLDQDCLGGLLKSSGQGEKEGAALSGEAALSDYWIWVTVTFF